MSERIYEFIESYIKEHQYSPSMREIADACGKISLSTVSYHLDALEAEGWIIRSWYKSRSIRLRSAEGTEDEITEEVYTVIVEAIKQEGLSPTQRDIADACHISKATVQMHLKRLEEQGRIVRENGVLPTIHISTSADRKILGTKISAMEVRGQTIKDFGQMEAIAQDQMSITLHGKRTLSLNLPSLDDADMAQDIADFELLRRKDPSGKVASLTVLSHGKNGGDNHAEQLALTIGDRIQVIEAQSGHNAEYFIIGEAHKLSESATRFETTWYLEAATTTNWARLNEAELDGEGVGAPEVPFIIAY